MFTGIIRYQGVVIVSETHDTFSSLCLKVPPELFRTLSIGSSVAVNGVCLTVVSMNDGVIAFDLIPETLQRTVLSDLVVGDFVHIEASLCFGDEVGGHFLSGHVFGIGVITEIRGRSYFVRVGRDVIKYLFEKGFVAIDGVSLTVVQVDTKERIFQIDLIPETLRATLLGNKISGSRVNIEIDFMTQSAVDTVLRFLKTHSDMIL
ncbi:MAG: riboflavin synthase subunit alpha [Victivallaceae bacterium]